MAAISVNYDMEVVIEVNDLMIRSGPSTANQIIGRVAKGTTVNATSHDGDWYFINNIGWSLAQYLRLITDYGTDTTTTVTPEQNEKVSSVITDDEILDVYSSYINSAASNNTTEFLTENMNNVLGLPYQFPGHVDRKLNGSVFGRKYAERIITNMPLLLLTPGKVDFMSNSSDSLTSKITDLLLKNGIVNDGDDFSYGDSALSSYVNKPGKYYTFAYDSSYYKYVNGINQSTAKLLGIGDVKVNIGGHTDKLESFMWQNAANPLMAGIGQQSMRYLCFYIDGINSKSENFSNDTMESQLASKINSYSDTAKEIQFLLGAEAGSAAATLQSDVLSQAQSTIDGIVDSTLSGNQLFKDLTTQFSTVANGGKLLFPLLYSDSTFSQSYDISMKLRCPNPTPLNWYLDIMVPLGFLYGLVMPRSVGTGNGYKSPYLVRGYYKSIFNVDLGLITDLTVSKGKEGSWTTDGLPTEVDVDLTIKDLYSVLFMSASNDMGDFISNDQFMSFLANQVGINVNRPDMERSLEMYAMLVKNKITQSPRYWADSVLGNINNNMFKKYQGLFKF